MASRWVDIGTLSKFRHNEGKSIKVGELRIAVFRIGERVFALQDRCSHIRAPLSSGFLEGEAVACPLHNALFDLHTGEALRGPAFNPVCVFETKIQHKNVFVKIDAEQELT